MEENKLTEEEKMLLKASQDFYSMIRYERKCENCGGKYHFSREDILTKKVQRVYEIGVTSIRYIKCPICDYEEEIE